MLRTSVLYLMRALLACLTLLFVFAPYAQRAEAHAYSASYSAIQLSKSGIEWTFAIDELSVMELTGGDLDRNGMLDEKEFDGVKEQLQAMIKQHIVLKLAGQPLAWTAVERLVLERKGSGTQAILQVTFPPASASQSLSFTDQLYVGDAKTNYVNLLTIQYGTQKSTAALSGDNRVWAIRLTEADFAGLPPLPEATKSPEATTPEANASAANVSETKASETKASAANAQPSGTQAATPGGATDQSDEAAMDSQEPTSSGAYSFLVLGIHHILGGYDHLLFLFSLLLARQTFKQYAAMITAFTVAHSLTLTLTVLGWIDVPVALVEPAIALSICYVALDNIFRFSVNRRWLVTFLFGLVHGMGFADVLKEMNLPGKELALDLISFNVGIELVQLAIVVVLIPLLTLLNRYRFAGRVLATGSGAALLLGGFWLAERILAV